MTTDALFVHYFTLDVFTDQRFGGNPLAVIRDARGLSSEQMLQITREFNYSETTFVLPPESSDTTRRVRIFTPGGEVPFAGHPTIGTAVALIFSGDVEAEGDTVRVVLGENVGPVPVTVRLTDGVPTWAQLSTAMQPVESPAIPTDALSTVLGISAADVMPAATHEPRVVSCGLPFLIVPLVSRAAVERARVDISAYDRHVRGQSCEMLLAFAPLEPGDSADLHVRVFCPADAVPEDPATGSANAALGAYLAARTPRDNTTLRWTAQQGIEMGRPSRLEIEVDKADASISAVRVAGSVVLMSEGRLRVR